METSVGFNNSESLNILDYNDFISYCKKDFNINIYLRYKYVANFYYNFNRSQIGSIVLDTDDHFIDRDIISCFNGFSVIPKGTMSGITKYLVFVKPECCVDSYFNEIEINLPTDINPTHVCILSNDPIVIKESFEKLKDINPDLVLINVLQNNDLNNEMFEKIQKRLKGVPLLRINDYCSRLSAMSSSFLDYKFYVEFDKAVEEILEKSRYKVVVFGGVYNSEEENIYRMLVIECSLRDLNFQFYIEPEKAEYVARTISSCLFDPDNQLVEDVINFLERFPRICLEYKGNYTVTNLIRSLSLTLKLKYVPLHNQIKREAKFIKARSTQINVIPMSTYFNLESDNLEDNIKEELRLRDFIRDLYDVLDLDNGIIDLSNLVFFELQGVAYVGCNLGYDLEMNCSSLLKELPLINRVFTSLDEINRFVYLPFFLNGVGYLEELSKDIKSIIRVYLTKDMARMSLKGYRKMSSVFKSRHALYNKELEQFPNILYLLGMCSQSSTAYRQVLTKNLVGVLGLENVRNKIDSFGGFNKINNDNLNL